MDGRPIKTEKLQVAKRPICSNCDAKIYGKEFACDGCEQVVCYLCSRYHSEDGVVSRWCPDCYQYIIINWDDEDQIEAFYRQLDRSPVLDTTKKLPRFKPHPQYAEYNQTPVKEDFFPGITDETFWRITGWLLDEPHVEIAGSFIYNPELNQITWAYLDEEAECTAASVDSNTGSATVAALLEGLGVPNGQFHTHPGFSAYFSGVDIRDQAEFIHDACQLTPKGYHVFLVFDQLCWRVALVRWQDGKPLARHQGYVRIRDKTLNFNTVNWNWRNNWNETGTTSLQQPTTRQAANSRQTEQQLLLPGVAGSQSLERPGWVISEPLVDEDRWLFVGEWSDLDEDYSKLFRLFRVPLGQWERLYHKIGKAIGYENYRSLVNNPTEWR